MTERRSVTNINWFEDPDQIWSRIVRDPYPYKVQDSYKTRLQARDVALTSLLYLSCARATEMVGGPVQITVPEEALEKTQPGTEIIEIREDPETEEKMYVTQQNLRGVTVDQVSRRDPDFLRIRAVPIIKQKYVRVAGSWVRITDPSMYPVRQEIRLPRRGSLSKFTRAIEDHLDIIGDRSGTPVFRIGRERAWQIVNQKTGDWPHYLRDQGFRLWYRIFENDAFKLKEFSGHKKWESLEHYMSELSDQDFKRALSF